MSGALSGKLFKQFVSWCPNKEVWVGWSTAYGCIGVLLVTLKENFVNLETCCWCFERSLSRRAWVPTGLSTYEKGFLKSQIEGFKRSIITFEKLWESWPKYEQQSNILRVESMKMKTSVKYCRDSLTSEDQEMKSLNLKVKLFESIIIHSHARSATSIKFKILNSNNASFKNPNTGLS